MVAGIARKAIAIKLNEDERDFLQRLVRRARSRVVMPSGPRSSYVPPMG